MINVSVHPSERRRSFRFSVQHQSRLRLTLDDASADGETIRGVTVTDISQQGLMAAGAGELVPGAQVLLEVPLVGWRDAEVMWIAENRAGCRFLEPLSVEELRLAAANSERLALELPALGEEFARLAPGEPAAPEPDTPEDATPRLFRPGTAIAALLLIAGGFLLFLA